MGNLAGFKYREIVRKLKKAGFAFDRPAKGSHEIWWNEKTKKTCVVPHHHEIKSGTLKSIINQANVTTNNFLKNILK